MADEPPSDSWRVAYGRDECPRCGMPLDPPNTDLNRTCPACHITIHAAEWTYE